MNMNDLEAQIERGQHNLGRLVHQFLAVNDLKHVQLMSMASATMGVRWLHSSQVSTLKRGGTKNLTGFPLYSLACVNKKIWEVNNGLARAPKGTRMEDWEGKLPMVNEDGSPLTVGDLWMVYFGEMEPPLFTMKDGFDIDDHLAASIGKKIRETFEQKCKAENLDELEVLASILKKLQSHDMTEIKGIKGIALGITEPDADMIHNLASVISDFMGIVEGKEYTENMVYELCLEDKN